MKLDYSSIRHLLKTSPYQSQLHSERNQEPLEQINKSFGRLLQSHYNLKKATPVKRDRKSMVKAKQKNSRDELQIVSQDESKDSRKSSTEKISSDINNSPPVHILLHGSEAKDSITVFVNGK